VHIVAEAFRDANQHRRQKPKKMLYLQTRIALQIAELKDRLRRQKGQGMVEYGLIIALVAIVLVAALTALNGGLQKVFSTITNTLNAN
jgi:pilus assembly protein Flp/PilA